MNWWWWRQKYYTLYVKLAAMTSFSDDEMGKKNITQTRAEWEAGGEERDEMRLEVEMAKCRREVMEEDLPTEIANLPKLNLKDEMQAEK